MRIHKKRYKTIKTKTYIKNNDTFFFFNGINRKSTDWILTEQKLKDINFKCYKVFNKTAIKTLNESVYSQVNNTINGTTFFVNPITKLASSLNKNILLNSFEPLLFTILALKINNKIYSAKQLKNTYSLKETDNKMLFFKFAIINLKLYYKS